STIPSHQVSTGSPWYSWTRRSQPAVGSSVSWASSSSWIQTGSPWSSMIVRPDHCPASRDLGPTKKYSSDRSASAGLSSICGAVRSVLSYPVFSNSSASPPSVEHPATTTSVAAESRAAVWGQGRAAGIESSCSRRRLQVADRPLNRHSAASQPNAEKRVVRRGTAGASGTCRRLEVLPQLAGQGEDEVLLR